MRSITDGEFRRAWFHLDFLAAARRRRRHRQHRRQLRLGVDRAHDAAEAVGRRAAAPRPRHPGRRLHVPGVGHDADAEGLDPVAHDGALPRRARRHRHRGVPRPRACSSPTWPRATGPRSPRCTRPAAATSSSTTPTSRTCATRSCAPAPSSAATIPTSCPTPYAELINACIADRPDDLTVGIHLCRGNYRSTWFAEGGYEPVAEVLFNELDVDAYFLEYDDERSGDFAPLRFVPDGQDGRARADHQQASRARADRRAGGARRRGRAVRAASSSCASARSAASPAPSRATRSPADQQWAKLRHVVETPPRIWG